MARQARSPHVIGIARKRRMGWGHWARSNLGLGLFTTEWIMEMPMGIGSVHGRIFVRALASVQEMASTKDRR